MMKTGVNANAKNLAKLIRKMHKRPRIRGVSILRPRFIDKICGSIDMKQHQLCRDENGKVLTPNIVRMQGCLDGFTDKTYAYAVRMLTGMFDETSSLDTELDNICARVDAPVETRCEEERRRQVEAATARRIRDGERMDEIRIAASLLKEGFAAADENIRHFLEHADRITQSHVSAYWRGILKVNAGQQDLPVSPASSAAVLEGARVYEEHMTHIMEMLDHILQTVKEGDDSDE